MSVIGKDHDFNVNEAFGMFLIPLIANFSGSELFDSLACCRDNLLEYGMCHHYQIINACTRKNFENLPALRDESDEGGGRTQKHRYARKRGSCLAILTTATVKHI